MNRCFAGNEIQRTHTRKGPEFVFLNLRDALFQVFDRSKRPGIALLDDFQSRFLAQGLHIPKSDAYAQALGAFFQRAVPLGARHVDRLELETVALRILY